MRSDSIIAWAGAFGIGWYLRSPYNDSNRRWLRC